MKIYSNEEMRSKDEATYTEDDVMYLLEMAFIIDDLYLIEWSSLEERFEVMASLYVFSENIFNDDSYLDQFNYKSEIYQSELFLEQLKTALKNKAIRYSKKINLS